MVVPRSLLGVTGAWLLLVVIMLQVLLGVTSRALLVSRSLPGRDEIICAGGSAVSPGGRGMISERFGRRGWFWQGRTAAGVGDGRKGEGQMYSYLLHNLTPPPPPPSPHPCSRWSRYSWFSMSCPLALLNASCDEQKIRVLQWPSRTRQTTSTHHLLQPCT